MALKLCEFVKQSMMETLMLKLTQFEKTGQTGKTFISLGNLIIYFHFGKLEVDHVFRDLYKSAVR